MYACRGSGKAAGHGLTPYCGHVSTDDVTRFQRDFGMPEDGIVGNLTAESHAGATGQGAGITLRHRHVRSGAWAKIPEV